VAELVTHSQKVRESVVVELPDSVADLIGGTRAAVVVIGGGGSGKSRVVQGALNAARDAGLRTRSLQGRRLDHEEPYAALDDVLPLELLERMLGTPSRFDRLAARRELIDKLTPGLLVVEDAQWIDPESITLLTGAATAAQPDGFRMLLAHRPRSSNRHLAALDEALAHGERPDVLGRLDDVAAGNEFADSAIGETHAGAVEQLVGLTGGQPALIAAVITTAEDDPGLFAAWLKGEPCPPSLVESVRSRVGHLSTLARDLLLTLSFGASPTDDELGELLQSVDDDAIAGAANELDDEGLLMSDGNDVIALVAEVATHLQAPVERRRHHRRFAEVLDGRGGSAVLRAEHLIAAGAAPRELTQACMQAADELMNDAPTLAMEWLDRAADAGVTTLDLAARRVTANVRDGRTVEALRAAEPLFRPGAQDRLVGLSQASFAFVQARRPLQAASVLKQIAPRLQGESGHLASLSAAICLLIGGKMDEGRKTLASDDRSITATDPAIEVARLLGDAVLHAADGEIDAAVVKATEACELELAAFAEQRLALTAAAIAPTLAIYVANLDLAHRLSRRAIAAPAATEAQRQSRVLRAELVRMWLGHGDIAMETIAPWDKLGPSDRLFACAVRAGAARRSNDLGRLRGQHEQVMEVLLHPPDLFSLPAYGEVMVAAARLGDHERVLEARTTRDAALQGFSDVTIVQVTRCWTDLQITVLADATDSPTELTELTERLKALDGLPGRLGDLVSAMITWCAALERRALPADIEAAGRRLQQIGFRWEATRLVGAAALRLDDGQAAKDLLATARELRASQLQAGTESDPLSARLSARELEVAELMVGGNTYKEIGGLLFISPKTVEHHVARIRQRLDVSTRAEMLDILRTELAKAGTSTVG